jgi:hypothetical protein
VRDTTQNRIADKLTEVFVRYYRYRPDARHHSLPRVTERQRLVIDDERADLPALLSAQHHSPLPERHRNRYVHAALAFVAHLQRGIGPIEALQAVAHIEEPDRGGVCLPVRRQSRASTFIRDSLPVRARSLDYPSACRTFDTAVLARSSDFRTEITPRGLLKAKLSRQVRLCAGARLPSPASS